MNFKSLPNILVREACVETLAECIAAEKNGANRLELCADLNVGGTTPSYELVQSVLKSVSIPVKVMIRSRGGDFVYTSAEIEEMKNQLSELKKLNPFGFVFGFLYSDFTMNFDLTREFCALCNGFDVTIHKAFDLVPDPILCFEELKKMQTAVSLLTSGQKLTAAEGKDLLKKLVDSSENKVKVIVAGKVTYQNINDLHSAIGASEYHGKKVV